MKEEVCVAVFTAQDRHFDEWYRKNLYTRKGIQGIDRIEKEHKEKKRAVPV